MTGADLNIPAAVDTVVTVVNDLDKGDDDDKDLSFPPTSLGRLQAKAHRHRFELLGLVFMVMYFIVPFSWRGATLLHERFLDQLELFVGRFEFQRLAVLIEGCVGFIEQQHRRIGQTHAGE